MSHVLKFSELCLFLSKPLFKEITTNTHRIHPQREVSRSSIVLVSDNSSDKGPSQPAEAHSSPSAPCVGLQSGTLWAVGTVPPTLQHQLHSPSDQGRGTERFTASDGSRFWPIISKAE